MTLTIVWPPQARLQTGLVDFMVSFVVPTLPRTWRKANHARDWQRRSLRSSVRTVYGQLSR